MTSYDLCLAWNWEYDAEFVRLLDEACARRGLSLLQVKPDNLGDLLHALVNQEIVFRAFLDRASEVDERFVPVVCWAVEQGAYRINPSEMASRCWDKAVMHLALLKAGLHTPNTTILPSYQEQPVVSSIDLHLLGERFIIKPAHGGGGAGLVTDATSLGQVLEVRREYPTDRYLLQAQVVPRQLGTRPAWFRVLYCGGCAYPCWWGPQTHVYAAVTGSEACSHGLGVLRGIAASIADLCGLDLFSTEIALSADGLFVVVDYVNDPVDLRLQSKAVDGVPDDLVQDIAERLVDLVVTRTGFAHDIQRRTDTGQAQIP
ncbi:MAG: hypothetical protein ABSF61_13765 [Anaerolineales bacterium]